MQDVIIRGNAFMNCEENAILIKPENKRFGGYVHSGILIENNLFVMNNAHVLNASSTSGITMRANVYKGTPLKGKWIVTENCENVSTDAPIG